MNTKATSLKKDSGPKSIRVNSVILKKIEKKYGSIQKYVDAKIDNDYRATTKVIEPRKK